MLFDYRFYNQDLAEASLVIEFGALANDIEQVRYSAELAGRSIANLLKMQINRSILPLKSVSERL